MTTSWLRRHRKILAWAAGSVALMLIALGVAGFALIRHLNDNITQVNVADLLGAQPVNLHPKAENILLIGSDIKPAGDGQPDSGPATAQAASLMLFHFQADRKWAEVMAIPSQSWVNVASCEESHGRKSGPALSVLSAAFAAGNRDGTHSPFGAACIVKTVEQDTGIYISHFIVMNLTGFQNMVAALGGVQECNPVAITDPSAGIVLSAGSHWLNSAQALAYVNAVSGAGNGTDLDRIARQQAIMSSVISRVKTRLYHPLAMYRFLDAFTSSLTIDSQLGGITGLYDFMQALRAISSSKIVFFALPTRPRSQVVPSDTTSLLWTQPEDSQIFASLRDDVPASATFFTPPAQLTAAVSRPGKFGVAVSQVTIPSRSAAQNVCVG